MWPPLRLIQKTFLTFSFILLVGAGLAAPHGNKIHVMGTLDKVAADLVTVKTTDGRSVDVKLSSSTVVVTSEGKAATVADLKPGMRVVIHATPKAKDLIADEVKFSVAATTPGHPANHS